jgi:hypothetical protein
MLIVFEPIVEELNELVLEKVVEGFNVLNEVVFIMFERVVEGFIEAVLFIIFVRVVEGFNELIDVVPGKYSFK